MGRHAALAGKIAAGIAAQEARQRSRIRLVVVGIDVLGGRRLDLGRIDLGLDRETAPANSNDPGSRAWPGSRTWDDENNAD